MAAPRDGNRVRPCSAIYQRLSAVALDRAAGNAERTSRPRARAWQALWLAGMLFDGIQEGSVRVVDPAIGGHIIMSTINSAYDVRLWAASQPLESAVSCYAGLLTNGIFD